MKDKHTDIHFWSATLNFRQKRSIFKLLRRDYFEYRILYPAKLSIKYRNTHTYKRCLWINKNPTSVLPIFFICDETAY